MASITIRALRGGGEGSGVSLFGDVVVSRGTSVVYEITDYNSFSSYSVTTDVGTASIADNQLTLNIPPSGSETLATLNVTKDGKVFTFLISLDSSTLITPQITFPPNNAINVPANLNVTATAYQTIPPGLGDLTQSEWEIATDTGFTDIVDSETIATGDKTRWSVSNLPGGVTLYLRVRYVSSSEGTSPWSDTITFTTTSVAVNTPTISYAGNTLNVPETPTFSSSAFATTPPGESGHLSSSWRVVNTSTSDVVFEKLGSISDKLSLAIPTGVLQEDTNYSIIVRHESTTIGASAWSSPFFFKTTEEFVPSVVGTPYGGGYYAGKVLVESLYGERKGIFAIVVAPKALGGEIESRHYISGGNTSTVGLKAHSLVDFITNWEELSVGVVGGTYLAKNWASDLNINGYQDWRYPPPLVSEIIYRAFKPGTTNNASGLGANPYAIPPTPAPSPSNPAQTSVTLFKAGNDEAFRTDKPYLTLYATAKEGSLFTQNTMQHSFNNNSTQVVDGNTVLVVRAVRFVKIAD